MACLTTRFAPLCPEMDPCRSDHASEWSPPSVQIAHADASEFARSLRSRHVAMISIGDINRASLPAASVVAAAYRFERKRLRAA